MRRLSARRWAAAASLALVAACERAPRAPRQVEPPAAVPSSPTTPGPCPDGTELGWDDFAHPFVTGWCAACHSSHLTGPARGGAPELVNLDTYEGVVANAVRVQATATGASPSMPPGGGPPSLDRERLLEWITCGMPGPTTPEPLDPCDAPLFQGDTQLASVDQVEAFCAAYSGATGTLTVEIGGELPCLCTVGGDLVLGAPEVSASMPALRSVGGTVTVADNPSLTVLALPVLAEAGGVLLARNPALASLDLGDLATVGGTFEAADDGVGGDLALDGIETVGGDLLLAGLPRVANVHLLRLASVGGSIRVSDAGATAIDLGPVDTVGGDVAVTACPALVDLDGMRIVDAIGGSITLSDLPALPSLGSFYQLLSVGADVSLDGLPALTSLDGFTALASVGGEVLIRGTSLSAAPAFPALATAGTVRIVDDASLVELPKLGGPGASLGGLVLRGNPALAEMADQELAEVSGPIEVCDTALHDLAGLRGLTDVGGDLTVCDNPLLENGFGLADLTHVGGDLTVRDNPMLPTAVARRVATSATVEGDVHVAGNR